VAPVPWAMTITLQHLGDMSASRISMWRFMQQEEVHIIECIEFII
jgi:hypothetical protein